MSSVHRKRREAKSLLVILSHLPKLRLLAVPNFDEHGLVGLVRVRPQSHVHMVAIGALGLLDVAIVRRHLHRPGLAVRADAAPRAALGRFDRDLQPSDIGVALGVVASLGRGRRAGRRSDPEGMSDLAGCTMVALMRSQEVS